MTIKSAAVVGALGVGLGIASFVGAGTASAADTCEADTPPFTAARAACVAGENLAIFGDTINPVNQVNTFLYGTVDSDQVNSGLGIVDQPQTFINSVAGPGGFLDGPRAPDAPDAPAQPHAPGAGAAGESP